ncbi:hypothetical protein MVES1_002834 [Malassezia vespertilionis]|uniref:RRM domain-containing protein n=1 Tax=Malassezia vespertilionis TaxID=2020962 RepID=A0A2N1JAL9_9BASI|nr:uncharacterized protein MVES1_002834 [Malassezia vespertilionis]PKI83596.1 hypothetical protein MVES_002679 [Malassezia vespertilionis]WFD07468.1 hypothetical protein MVES1_002834 [Malassezia vespertilionis]
MDGPTRLYVGHLPPDVHRDDLGDFFCRVGRVIDVRVLSGFGFVEFENPRDADAAVQDFDGASFMGERLMVQFAKQPQRRDRDRDDGFRSRDRDRDRDSFGPPRARSDRPPRNAPRRGMYRIVVFNLPEGTSWQDLKDIGREYGSITFSNINRSRPDEGVIEYDNREDYELALSKIEGTELGGSRLRVEPEGEVPPPSMDRRERSPGPERRHRDDGYPPRDGDRWRNERPPRRDYRDERPPPPMREDEREPPPPREDERELLPSREDEREPLPIREDEHEDDAPAERAEPPSAPEFEEPVDDAPAS